MHARWQLGDHSLRHSWDSGDLQLWSFPSFLTFFSTLRKRYALYILSHLEAQMVHGLAARTERI